MKDIPVHALKNFRMTELYLYQSHFKEVKPSNEEIHERLAPTQLGSPLGGREFSQQNFALTARQLFFSAC